MSLREMCVDGSIIGFQDNPSHPIYAEQTSPLLRFEVVVPIADSRTRYAWNFSMYRGADDVAEPAVNKSGDVVIFG